MRDLPSPTKVQEQNSLSAAPELERRLSGMYKRSSELWCYRFL